MDNTGEAWRNSSAIKSNDGASAQSLCIFLKFYLSILQFRLTKMLGKQVKNGYFDIATNFEYQFNNFIIYLLFTKT